MVYNKILHTKNNRDAIIKNPARGSTFKGNFGHRNTLIFQWKLNFFEVMTFFSQCFVCIHQFYRYFIKIQPKSELWLKSGQRQSLQIWQFMQLWRIIYIGHIDLKTLLNDYRHEYESNKVSHAYAVVNSKNSQFLHTFYQLWRHKDPEYDVTTF